MVIEILDVFLETCGVRPERIVFYRDGITEVQAHDIVKKELSALKRACQAWNPDYNPTITFIAVQKRHHARFFPIRKEDADKSGNILPGTVIEDGVTHPFGFGM